MTMRFVLACLIALSGCRPMPAVVPTQGPEGQWGWLQLNCPGKAKECRRLAAENCPYGYDAADFRNNGSRYGSPSGLEEQIGAPGKNGQMLVQCKSAPPPPTPAKDE